METVATRTYFAAVMCMLMFHFCTYVQLFSAQIIILLCTNVQERLCKNKNIFHNCRQNYGRREESCVIVGVLIPELLQEFFMQNEGRQSETPGSTEPGNNNGAEWRESIYTSLGEVFCFLQKKEYLLYDG